AGRPADDSRRDARRARPPGPCRRRRPRCAVGAPSARDPRRGRVLGAGVSSLARRRLSPVHRPHVRRGGSGGDPMTLIRHTLYMTLRPLRELWRQPWFVAVTLVQPVIWLLLFGALFKRVIEIPGFHSHSYIAFLAPGVVVMTALFNSAWSG